MVDPLRIGVLAIQGAFAEHRHCLETAACPRIDGDPSCLQVVEVRKPADLDGLDGLVLPGGESTTTAKFLQRDGFKEALEQWMQGFDHRKPVVWGTCAGLILLANRLEGEKKGGQLTLGGLDVTVLRNVYGRQCESFEALLELHHSQLHSNQHGSKYHGIFIRAPGIKSVDSDDVEVLATVPSGDSQKVVAVRQGHVMATTFHPELTDDLRWHRYFLQLVAESRNRGKSFTGIPELRNGVDSQ